MVGPPGKDGKPGQLGMPGPAGLQGPRGMEGSTGAQVIIYHYTASHSWQLHCLQDCFLSGHNYCSSLMCPLVDPYTQGPFLLTISLL